MHLNKERTTNGNHTKNLIQIDIHESSILYNSFFLSMEMHGSHGRKIKIKIRN